MTECHGGSVGGTGSKLDRGAPHEIFLAHYNVVGLELDEGFACQLAV